MSPPDNESRLRELFDDHSRRIYAYAVRHSDPETAQDVVADVFLVAWRRIDEVPQRALPWLLVAARNVLRNHARSGRRRARLTEVVAQLDQLPHHVPSAESYAVERATMLAALAHLTSLEREALLLTTWDGLSAREAAEVAGCSTRAFEVRLSRARRRLERLLISTASPASSPAVDTDSSHAADRPSAPLTPTALREDLA